MELTQLFQFKVLAESKTMTEAAERLHISQPALSSSLKRLETELGVQLFERRKNKLFLNEAGKKAFVHACAVLERAEKMKSAFCRNDEKSNSLFLGFCDAGPMRFSVPLLQKAWPELNILSEIPPDDTHISGDLLSRKYDAVVSLEQLKHPDVISIPFAKEELMLSVPDDDPLALETAVCLRHHQDREIIAYRIYGAYERKIQPFLDWLETLPSVTVYTDYFVFRQMLEHKKVLTFTTRLVHLYRYDGGSRVIIPLTDQSVSAVYWLSYLKTNKKQVKPVLQWRRENIQTLLGTEAENYK